MGIPKDISFLEGWRDFLDLLNNGILVETGKVKSLRRQTPVQRLATGRMQLVDYATEFCRAQMCFSLRAMRNTVSFVVGARTRFAFLKNLAGILESSC